MCCLTPARWLERLDLRIELLSVVESVDFATTHAGMCVTLTRLLKRLCGRASDTSRVSRGLSPGVTVTCVVEQGQAEKIIVEKAARDKETLIGMATRGRSGIHRWLMGSVAEKVLRGATNPLLLVRGDEEGKSDGEATLKSIVVPLDGSKLAETVLPPAVDLAKKLSLEIVLTRAYQLPLSAYAGADAAYIPNSDAVLTLVREEASAYLEAKVNELRAKRNREGLLHFVGRLRSRRDHRPGAHHSGQFDRHVHPRTLRGKALGAGKRNRKGRASLGRSGFGCQGRVSCLSLLTI